MSDERALLGGPELHSLAAQYGANEGPLPIVLDLLQCEYEKSGSAIRQIKPEHTLGVSPKPVRTNKN